MHSLRFFGTFLVVSSLIWASPTLADDSSGDGVTQQDGDGDGDGDDDDDLDDILGGSGGDSPDQERRDLREGRTGDKIGARKEGQIEILEDDGKNRRIIKTIQRKTFTKLGRFEASPHVAFVANDPFLNRYIVGTGINYNITEIFAVEANLDFSPDLAEADWKPLTKQLIEENHVSPDISKLTYFGNVNFLYSPIYGKVAVVGRKIINFDIYGSFGMGVTRTSDDLQALDTTTGDDRAEVTQHQMHPTTNFGGGARVIFSKNMAARLEGRSMVYIETVNATTLEMKNNMILQLSMSFFFPNMQF
jgi:outer membrane beta-barrel protein